MRTPLILNGFGTSLTRSGPDSLVRTNFFLERIFAVYAGYKILLKLILCFGVFFVSFGGVFLVKFFWFQN